MTRALRPIVLALILVLAGTGGTISGWSVAISSAPTSIAAASGGWRPTSVYACALALGLIVGGAVSMPLNPMGGAVAISGGFHLGLFACT